jgi:hypothetical protein
MSPTSKLVLVEIAPTVLDADPRMALEQGAFAEWWGWLTFEVVTFIGVRHRAVILDGASNKTKSSLSSSVRNSTNSG